MFKIFSSPLFQNLLVSFLIITLFYEVVIFLSYFQPLVSSQILGIFSTQKICCYFVLIILTIALIYVTFLKKEMMEKKTALNCSTKMSIPEYKNMIEENTEYHLKKLSNTNQFKNYMMKKMMQKKPIDFSFDEDSIEFSDEN